jgi:pimeloyl-ACP methyl ester carboxylesterase
MDEPSLVSRRVPGDGTETGGFIGPTSARIFLQAHLPDSPKASAILCPSLFSEQLTNYRTEVLLGRALASTGVACARFQYRGTGNSDDLAERYPTLTTMTEDARTAEDWLVERAGRPTTLFIGVRVGALVAARSIAARPEVSLCCIEPVLEGARWLRELARAQRTANMRSNGGPPTDDDRSVEELEEFQAVGYQVGRATVSSLRNSELDVELGPAIRDVLVLQVSPRTEMGKELSNWLENLRARGSQVHAVPVRQGRSWWFVPEAWEIEEQRPETSAVREALLSWVNEAVGA